MIITENIDFIYECGEQCITIYEPGTYERMSNNNNHTHNNENDCDCSDDNWCNHEIWIW